MNAGHALDEATAGMRLDDWMYPFCLKRYAGTEVHDDLSPASQLDTERLGYGYEDLYPVLPAE